MPERYSELAAHIWPFILPKVERLTDIVGSEGAGAGGIVSGAPSPHDLNGAHHSGLLASSQAPQFLLTDGTRNLTGNLAVGSGVTIDGTDISAHVADPDAHHARATAGNGLGISGQQLSLDTPGTLTAATTNAVTADSHTHAITAVFDADATPGALLKSDEWGNLEVRAFRADSISADGDLTIDPVGVVQFPNAQTITTPTFSSGYPLAGWRIDEPASGDNRLVIGQIFTDELFARVFVADEVRVDRGEEYWSKSFGITIADFVVPAIDAGVGVTFEDSPALGNGAALFSVGDWLMFKTVDIGTGLTIAEHHGQVYSYVDNGNFSQTWTFTLRAGTPGLTVHKGSLAVCFGTSGQGAIHLSALTIANGPWTKYQTWTSNPYTAGNWTTHTAIGNLNGTVDYVTAVFGFAAGNNLAYSPTGSPAFRGLTADATNGLRLFNTDIAMRQAGLQVGGWASSTGNFVLGSYLDSVDPDLTNLVFFGSGQTWDAETFQAGDLMVGSHGAANMFWDKSAGQLKFRNSTTVEAYVDTDGTIKAGGGNVSLSSTGIDISVGGTFHQTSSLTFLYSGTEVAQLYSYLESNTTSLALECGDTAGNTGLFVIRTHTGVAEDRSNMTLYAKNGEEYARFSVFNTTFQVNAGSAELSGGYLVLPNNTSITFKDSGAVVRSALYMSTGNDLVIGYGLQTGNYVSIAPIGAGRLNVYSDKIEAEEPIFFNSDNAINSPPPTAGSSTGWKMGLYGSTWAIGISPLSLAIRQGDTGWLALFNDDEPNSNATATAKDTAAYFGVNVNYLQYNGAFGHAWTAMSLGTGWENYSVSFHAAAYKKVGDLVFLRGLIRHSGAGSGSGTSILSGNLPSGYYHGTKTTVIGVTCSDGGDPNTYGQGHLTINSSGTVTFYGDEEGWVTLDGICYSVA